MHGALWLTLTRRFGGPWLSRSAIQASPVPEVRQLASWETNLLVHGSFEVSSDSHTLLVEDRVGQGLRWCDWALWATRCCAATLSHPPTHCLGPLALAPLDP